MGVAGVPATLPAGPVSVSFTNDAPPEQQAPVLLVGRLKDGATYTLDGIRSGAEDLHTAFDIVVAAESPAAVKYANVDLRPGRYVVVSPTGAPEFTGMLLAEVDVR